GRMMTHSKTTMVINNNQPRGRKSPRSTIWDRVKGNHMGETCLSVPGAIFIKMACVLRNATSALRSFISTAFSSPIDIIPTLLGNSYDVELADGKIVGVDTIMQGCTLNFLNPPFNIDLMPVELGSFDVIIGMDWLRRYHAVIVCDEKLVRDPYGNETLIFHSDESNDGRESRLTIISSSKAQEYMEKGLFPEDLPGFPPARPVEFQIDLVPGAAPVARAPYRLAPSKMKELPEKLQELSDKGFIRPSFSPWGSLDKKEDEEHRKAILELLMKEKFYAKFSKWKANVMAEALSHKDMIEPLRVRALVMTIGLDLPKRILEAQIKALKLENLINEDVCGLIRKDIPKEKLESRADETLCLNGRSW
nr:putative reverse transcriptase domain-containing protein [Tanacetum cinerariifolium]